MLKQLKELTLTKERFGVGFSVAEAWDYMQIKVTYIRRRRCDVTYYEFICLFALDELMSLRKCGLVSTNFLNFQLVARCR